MDTIKAEKGKLTVVKGKMAAGKSMAMLIDAKDYIDFKMGVLFFSLEQSSSKLYDKFFDKVKAKKENSEYMHVIDLATSLETIEKIIYEAKDKVSIIYIDSLEAIKNGTDYACILSKFYSIAKEIQIPIVISSQVCKENEDTTDLSKLVDELKALIPQEFYADCKKQIVLRDFSKYESYDYFSSTVRTVNEDDNVSIYSSFNLSDYFNN